MLTIVDKGHRQQSGRSLMTSIKLENVAFCRAAKCRYFWHYNCLIYPICLLKSLPIKGCSAYIPCISDKNRAYHTVIKSYRAMQFLDNVWTTNLASIISRQNLDSTRNTCYQTFPLLLFLGYSPDFRSIHHEDKSIKLRGESQEPKIYLIHPDNG